ncbi:MAG: hypothetical protein RI945_292 [Candidatus Parcubacteria bacterium]|jgi:hypothetical protein
MPTKEQLSLMREAENEYPEIRKDPIITKREPLEVKIKEGEFVYYSILGRKKVKVKVLKIKPDGKLILATRQLGLIKNVCVKPHRVTKV